MHHSKVVSSDERFGLADFLYELKTDGRGPPKRKLVSDFRLDSIETEGGIRKRYSRIYEKVKPIKGKEAVQEFVFNCGFDADGGLGAGLNQSSVDFILWLASSYHDLIHIFRCGAQGKDQVERMAKKLYGEDGFFHDIHKYVGKSPTFVESLPTADSVADPSGVIAYLKKIGIFDDAQFGYMGAACWATKRNLPANLPVPEQTVHGEPMGTVYYENRDGSMREKVELLLKYGRPAYAQLFDRLQRERVLSNKGLGACFLGAQYSVHGHANTLLQDFDPPESESEPLFWCILQTLNYYRTVVMKQNPPPVLFKEAWLMDPSNWNKGEFTRKMESFYAFAGNLGKVHQKILNFKYVLAADGPDITRDKIRQTPWESMEHLFLLSFCYNIHFNLFSLRPDNTLQRLNVNIRSNYVDYGLADSNIVKSAFPLVVNLMNKKRRFSVLLESSNGLVVTPSVSDNTVSIPPTTSAASGVAAVDDSDSDDELAQLPPLPPDWHPPLVEPVVTDLTGNTETLPGFTHYSNVDWNEFLTVPNASAAALDKNTLQIVENGFKMPVKTHMSQVQDRFKLVEVDPRFYSGLFGYVINGFRGRMVPSGVAKTVNKIYEYRKIDLETDVFAKSIDKIRQFFRMYFNDTIRGAYSIPRYAYNLSFYTDKVVNGTRYANNFLREKSDFDYFFYKHRDEHKVHVKISPVLQDGKLAYVQVSLDNAEFLPNEVVVNTSGMCKHRYKLRRTDWCGKYAYLEENDYFKLEIKREFLYGTAEDGYAGKQPYKPKLKAQAIQAEESYYLFFHATKRTFCIIDQYQFDRHNTATRKPWTDADLKAFAFSDRKLSSDYSREVWRNEFVETFHVKGGLRNSTDFVWSYTQQTCKLQYANEEAYEFTLPQPLETLTVRYSVDIELETRQNQNIETHVKTIDDRAKMWNSIMQSKPWDNLPGRGVVYKRCLEDDEWEVPESERIAWKPPGLREGDKWWFLDEVQTKKNLDEIPEGKRGNETKKLLREGILAYGATMRIGGVFYWYAWKMHIETTEKINPDLQKMFDKYLGDSLPLKTGEMDLCIPEYSMHFEAMNFFNLGLAEAGKSDFLYNLCMSVYVALLSLWKQPNAFCRLDFKQMTMLNYLMSDAWSNSSKFLKAMEDRLQQPEIRKLLVRTTVSETFTLETWRLVMPGILSCVRVSTSDIYARDLLKLANTQLLAKMEQIKEDQKTQAIRQKSDFDFMRYVHTFDNSYKSVQQFLTVQRPVLPALPTEYGEFNSASELTHSNRFECISFDLDFANLKRFRFEDETPNTHSFDFNPPDSVTGDSLKRYVGAYSEAHEACDSFYSLYMLCMMIRYPDDARYQGYQSRFFYVVLCELWANVFQRCVSEHLQREAASCLRVVHGKMCWLVRGAITNISDNDSQYIFKFTQSALMRLLREDIITLDTRFTALVFDKAMGFKNSAHLAAKKWTFKDLNHGMDKIREVAKTLLLDRIKASTSKWDSVMLEIFRKLSTPYAQRETVRHKVSSAFEREGILNRETSRYKDIKEVLWFKWDYQMQRDVYRDNMLSRYMKQIQKLRIVNIRDGLTQYYNTIDLGHVNILREAQKSFSAWINKKSIEEQRSWQLHPAMSDSFYHTKLTIDKDRFFAEKRPPTAPSLPASRAAEVDPSVAFPSLPANREGNSNSDFGESPADSVQLLSDWGRSDKKLIEPAVPVPKMDFSQFMDDAADIFKHRRITQIVTAYSGRFAPLISPEMRVYESDPARDEHWSKRFSDPFEYNLGVFKICHKLYDDFEIKDLVVFDAKQTAEAIRTRELSFNKTKHVIFFTSACNVFHYIRSIPLTLKYYRFNKDRDESDDLKNLHEILSDEISLIEGGELYNENVAFAERNDWQLLQNLMQIAHEDNYDEATQTFATKREIERVTKEIEEAKQHLESVYNEDCIVPISEEHAKLTNLLGRLKQRQNAPQDKIAEIQNKIAAHEAKSNESRLKLEKEKNKKIEEAIRSLDGLTKTLRSLQTEVFDIQFHFNERLLKDKIKAADDFLKKLISENKDTKEAIECLKKLREEEKENKVQHENKLKLLAGRTEVEVEQYLRDSKELARINSMQQETRTNTHDIYVNFLRAQQKRLQQREQQPKNQPEIQIQTEDLRDLLLNVGVKADNFWIAPLWMVESFIRDFDKLEKSKLVRNYAEYVKTLLQEKRDNVVAYCGCIKYFLHNINMSKGRFVFEKLIKGVRLPEFDLSTSFAVHKQASFLGYGFSADTKQIVEQADRNSVLSVICSAANLNMDVYEPYYNLKCALVAESGSNDFASSIMLDHKNMRNYQTNSRFFFAENEGITEQTLIERGEAQFALIDKERTVVRGQNKPVFYVDLVRRKLVQNLGWDDGTDRFSFFKSLAHNGFYTDDLIASHEFVFAVMREISSRLNRDKQAFNDIISERMDELYDIYQHETKYSGVTKFFHKLSSNQIWVYYCQLLCKGLPKRLSYLSENLRPTKAELQCFCDQLHTRFEITKMQHETEFSVIDSEKTMVVSKSNVHDDWYKQVPENAGKSVVRMLNFDKADQGNGVFCRLVDCEAPSTSPLPDTLEISKQNQDQNTLSAGTPWEGGYTRLSKSRNTKVCTKIRDIIKDCKISGVFNNDVFLSDSDNGKIFILWRVCDSWIIQTLQNFTDLAQWFSDPNGKNTNPVAAVARIDYKADIRGECTWYLKDNKPCGVTVTTSTTVVKQTAVEEPTSDKVPVEPFRLYFLNAGCSRWPKRAKNTEFSKRLRGLCMFRQEGGLVPMRLWQATEGVETEMNDDMAFQGTMRRRRTRRVRAGRLQDGNADDDSSNDESSDEESGNQNAKKKGEAWGEDDVGGGGNFTAKQKSENMKQQQRQSKGKGKNSVDKKTAKAAREAQKAASAAGGGGTGKHVRAKDYVSIQSSGGKRGGVKKVGAKNLCPNRLFGVTLFADRKAREAFWNREGDAKSYDYFNAYHAKRQRAREEQQEEAADLKRTISLFRKQGLIKGQFQGQIQGSGLFLGSTATGLQEDSDKGKFTVIGEDLKPSFMLTTGLFESIVTLETFGSGDCVSIKLIQGTTEQCMTLALFLSCFFEESTTLCMFDQFTDNLTFAGKGFVPEMADFWDSTGLLMSVADITPEAFFSLREKIPSIWESREYFMDDDGVPLHEHEERIRANSTKLWWAHHRSLTIAALAFITCGLYGKVWPCKYITEEEAWKATQLLHKSKDSHDILQSLSYSPFGGQLKPIYDMAEFVAVRHPMRPIYTHGDRVAHATVEMFTRPAPAAARMQRSSTHYLLQ